MTTQHIYIGSTGLLSSHFFLVGLTGLCRLSVMHRGYALTLFVASYMIRNHNALIVLAQTG